MLAVLAIAAVGAAALLWQRQSARRIDEAAARLAGATDVSSLESIIRDYSGTQPAIEALILLADLHYREGRFSDAAGTYERFLASYPGHSLAESARLGLAAVEEAQGNFQSAKAKYGEIIALQPNGYTAIAAKMGAARCAEALGQIKEARQIYEELMVSAQGSPWQSQAYLRWVVLGRDLPRESLEQPSSGQLQLAPPAPAGNQFEEADKPVLALPE